MKSEEVINKVGISYRQLDHWINSDIPLGISPKKIGSGYRRQFITLDLYILEILKELGGLISNGNGDKMVIMRKVAEQIKNYPAIILTKTLYITEDGDVSGNLLGRGYVLITSEDSLRGNLEPGDYMDMCEEAKKAHVI